MLDPLKSHYRTLLILKQANSFAMDAESFEKA